MKNFSELLSKLAVLNKYSYNRFRTPSIRRPVGVMEMERISRTRRELGNQFNNTMLTMLGGAFAFVMALFWNDAIKETITAIIPANQTLFYKYLAAIMVTLIGVLAILVSTKLFKKA